MSRGFTLPQQTQLIVQLFLLLTVVELINMFTGRALNQFGLIPRDESGLIGILTAPFLHGHFWHYLSNIVPICIFCWLSMYYGKRCFWKASIWILFITGGCVWLFGRSAVHIGASGIVYGYFGFLLLAGFYSGRIRMMLLSLLVGFFYGGLIFGVLPIKAFMSWESHLFGFLAGISAAYLFVDKK